MARARLVLMRHAKSAYPVGVPDHDRPLNERGLRDVTAAQQWFAQHGPRVLGDQASVLVSTAVRTQQSWQGIQSAFDGTTARLEPAIYEAAISTLIDLLAVPVGAGQNVLLIGHNPSIERLADFLADPSQSVGQWNQREKYPTCAIAVLELKDDSWARDSATISQFVVPRG